MRLRGQVAIVTGAGQEIIVDGGTLVANHRAIMQTE